MKPSPGRIVLYTLTEQDADAINKRRADAQHHIDSHRETANGAMVHVGNNVRAGDEFPLVITRIWGDDEGSAVNGQVVLDGNDTFWVASVMEGEGPRYWRVPPRV